MREPSAYYDPYDPDINADPYPFFSRLREEAPLFYNEEYDFYALSRFEDCERGFADNQTYISGRGAIIELIKANLPIPPGSLIFEDPPVHTIHRSLLGRVFTPRRMNALEDQVRAYCAECLDARVGAVGFDMVADLGAKMPVRVIGMLLGIPEEDQDRIRERADAGLRTEAGESMSYDDSEDFLSGTVFDRYIEWRIEHPSDDLMTRLMNAEFEDETGRTRRLERGELSVLINVLAGAGSETTTRLLGWAAKLLAEHPDQRRLLVENPSLIPAAVEEVLRFEPPAPHVGRCVAKTVTHHGVEVPEGSPILFLVGSANRDERRFERADTFDIRRPAKPHLSFGHGIHFCLGAALARLEGRVALEEVLKRFPEWEVDYDRAKLASTSTVRGWESMPLVIG